MSPTPQRIIGVSLGAALILALGVYGPATLLGPLPAAAVTAEPPAVEAGETARFALPEDGQSAVALVPDETGEPVVLAGAGDDEALPMGGAAKLVTVLVTQASQPLTAGDDGADIRIGAEDYRGYLNYDKEGSRVLPVSPGETWTQRDVVQAVLLASSNNHADTLVRWAFGNPAAYVEAANAWLDEHGFEHTRVDDATGLSGDNVGTATELARLTAMIMAVPALADMIDHAGERAGLGERTIPDVIAHMPDRVRALSRSYTDQAGLVFAFTDLADTGEDAVRIVGVLLRMPDYETLDPAVERILADVESAASPRRLVEAGTSYAKVTTPWGQRSELVASVGQETAAFGGGAQAPDIRIDDFATGRAGDRLGRITIDYEGGTATSPLELSDDLRDPGVFWRLGHPIIMVNALFGSIR
ncbi:serine hydrolase [Agromyces archimandritae]|uniref:Serine hydrolase n=1 Tax=Agromyces archimandritae TaxID=2781962 RepID=A0A975IPZ7_9MICO|nr:serine hydrolase [Agromyces archimandritae]QTX04521.1 serine hydrolase [Agromyces archimandritae]